MSSSQFRQRPYHLKRGWSYKFYERIQNAEKFVPRQFKRHRVLPRPKDQGIHHTCASHAAVMCMETRLRIRFGNQFQIPTLSIQHCIDGARASSIHLVLKWLKEEGVTTERAYPFEGPRAREVKHHEGPLFYLKGHVTVSNFTKEKCNVLVETLVNEGPFIGRYAVQDIHGDHACLKNGGCTVWVAGEEGRGIACHVITVTGYRRSKRGKSYWIFLNSGGSDWGANGMGTINVRCVDSIYVPIVTGRVNNDKYED